MSLRFRSPTAAFDVSDVGKQIQITSAGVPANNRRYTIETVEDANTVEFVADDTAQADPQNGKLSWQMIIGCIIETAACTPGINFLTDITSPSITIPYPADPVIMCAEFAPANPPVITVTFNAPITPASVVADPTVALSSLAFFDNGAPTINLIDPSSFVFGGGNTTVTFTLLAAIPQTLYTLRVAGGINGVLDSVTGCPVDAHDHGWLFGTCS